MNFYQGIADYPDNQRVVLSVGKFSSLHLGHQRIIRKMVALARAQTLAGQQTRSLLVLIFSPQHMRFFPFDVCCQMYEAMKVDDVVLFSFKDIFRMTYQDFLTHLLKKIRLKMLVASDKLSIGYQKQGTREKITHFLETYQGACGGAFSTNAIPPAPQKKTAWFSSITFGNVVKNLENYSEFSDFHQKTESFSANETKDLLQDFVSSSSLMDFVKKGYVEKARKFTFLPFMLRGIVVHGRGNGKKYGFPTANFPYPEGIVVCKSASYAALAVVNGQCYRAMSYVGMIEGKRFVETYLFNFQGLLYNDELRVFLLSHLRDDQKPCDVQHLTQMLYADAEACRAFFDELTQSAEEIHGRYPVSFCRLLQRLVGLGFLRQAKIVSDE